MESGGNISDYRSKLDKTLASPELTNDETIYTLVKNQILQSSDHHLEEYTDYVVERRSKEISNFLSMLRSASVNDVEKSKSNDESQIGWKVKQDTEEFRVMYQEGPEGTPFHTLLVEGYVDGPLDVCLCISCESDLYKKWWPQTAIPTFKVISSQCVKRVGIGEQILLVRMKVSWPLSSREVLVHSFAFEYLQDGLVVVLLNSISESETIARSTHGFTRDGIPDAEDVVRIDLVGGFALQKVTENRSYFRTIANMDIKLDFVPPAFINFISRQLIGSGFKLYKKEVASVSKGDEKFHEAVKDPLYVRIHEALYSRITFPPSPALEEHKMEPFKGNSAKADNECDNGVIDSDSNDVGDGDRTMLDHVEEFEENDTEESESLDKRSQKSCDQLTNQITEEDRTDEKVVIGTEVEQTYRTTNDNMEHSGPEMKNKLVIRPEVQRALGTLEMAISIVREYNGKPGKCQSEFKNGRFINSEDESISLEADQIGRKNENESTEIGSTDLTSHEPGNSSDNHSSRHKGSNSYTTDTNQSKNAPGSPAENGSSPSHVKHIDPHFSMNQKTVSTVFRAENYSLSADASSIYGSGATNTTKRKNKISRGRKYKIQVEELEKKYKDWQKKLHPDLVHSKSQREREYAAEQSARVIDAYRTLTDPLLRAIYIVKLEGILVDEEERITDPELLAEVMELREAVDEAEDTRALNEIQAQLQDKLRYWSDAFDDAYVRGNYDDALASIRRMTYYRRTSEEIMKKL
ncbi:Iron-sulfur cluster co-chaperone protein HscB [Sesamum alatum]|uniref:Iron-sulfur cluster co-chaperone protein HscB n=1 Tax=Sesamum alatum TaxID=300844 RepID=A0AAE1XNX1_9LAMI|nr:Iron-sulfur cluster co-chaperone protein HscB [Sesamum alatum]